MPGRPSDRPRDGTRSVIGSNHYAVIDCETTGFASRRGDRIVEAAVVRVDAAGAVLGEWVTLIDPGRDVGPSHIHGVTDDDVADAPTFAQVAGELARRLAGAVVVAHNAGFDRGFMRAEFARLGCSQPEAPWLCTMRLARALRLPVRDFKLETCCDHFGIDCGAAHTALDDARSAAGLLMRLFEIAADGGHLGLAALREARPAPPLTAWPSLPPPGATRSRAPRPLAATRPQIALQVHQ